MTPIDLLLEKPTCRRQVWLIGYCYPQNIQRTSATPVNELGRSGGRGVIASQSGGLERRWTRRPVSRVLCRLRRDAAAIPLDRPLPDGSRDLPGCLGPATALPPVRERTSDATPLFGLAPGGACHAVPVTRSAVGSYPTLSPLPQARARRDWSAVSDNTRFGNGGMPRKPARRRDASSS